jgi:hypothetical protein
MAMIASRYSEKTLINYANHVRRLENHNLPCSLVGFRRFLLERPGKMLKGQSIFHMWAALQLDLRPRGVQPTSADVIFFKLAMTAYHRASLTQSLTAAPARGAILAPMVASIRVLPLSTIIKYFKHVDNLYGIILQYVFALRTGEVARLMTTSIQLSEGKYMLTQMRAKPPSGRNYTFHTMLEHHVGSTVFNAEVAGILAQAPSNGAPQRLLPEYSMARVNDGLKLAAKHFGWDESTPWSSHGLRFGSISDAWAEARAELDAPGAPVGNFANDILARVQQRSGHLDPEMAFWYSLTATERADRVDACRKAIHARLALNSAAEKRRFARRTRPLARASGQRRGRTLDASPPSSDREVDQVPRPR